MAYTPSAFDITRPVDTDIAETAQLEFRTMKAFYMGTVAKFGSVAGSVGAGSVTLVTTSIPAGILGTTKTIKLRASGFIINSTGGAANTSWAVLYAGITVSAGTFSSAGTGNYAWLLEVEITADGLTNAQRIFAQAHIFTTDSSSGTAQDAIANRGARNTATIDSTIAQNLILNTQNSSAVNYTTSMDKAQVMWQ